jgi:outer membrane protein assembly factor BamB
MSSGGKSRIVLLLFVFLAVCFSICNGFDMTFGKITGDTKERDAMFMLDGVEYPVQYANVQRNSHVGLTTGAKGVLLWSKEYRNAEADITPAPGTVLIKGDTIGVVSPDNLLFYTTAGSFRYMLPIGRNTPVVFGSGAFAYIGPTYLLNYQEYSKKVILEGGEFPSLEEWAYVMVFKPGKSDFLAAVQFTGGPKPQREPPQYDVYRKEIEKSRIRTAYTGEGTIRHAMLTNDHRRFVLIQGKRVNLVETVDMKAESGFDLEYSDINSASLDPAGNLVFIGRGAKNKGERPYLSAVSLDGKLLWEYPLQNPQVQQPPACGGAGQVYVVDAGSLKSISNGRLAWSRPVKGTDKAWLTITKDDAAIMVQAESLTMIDAAGVVKFSVHVSGDEERFDAPPAVDAKGRIYVAGNRKLYCFE